MADYRKLNVTEIINASGTLTILGGSLIRPEVLEAMTKAAGSFVSINELLEKSSAYLAQRLGVGGVLIVNGAAAGMMTAISACMAGTDIASIRRLPFSGDLKNEVIVFKSHRNLYDQALRQTGAVIREIGLSDFTFEWDLRSAFTDKTCAVVYYAEFEEKPGSLPLAKVIEIAKEFAVPVIVDAAAELPPVENLWNYYKAGADLVLFSGGKDLRGPQSAGLIVGSKEMIDLCRFNGFPNYGIARPCKAAKEEIVGMVTAVELYLEEDQTARFQGWQEQTRRFLAALKPFSTLNPRQVYPGTDYIRPSCIPRVYFELPTGGVEEAQQFQADLMKGDPGLALAREGRTLIFNPHVLKPGEEVVAAEKVLALLDVYLNK